MRLWIFALVLIINLPAQAMVEKEYEPDQPMVTTPWFATKGAAARQADLDFVKGMRPHHAGALSMSQDYLQSAEASHPALKQLARGIIHNQTFEIGVLDMVEKYAKDHTGQIAAEGQAQIKQFLRAPVPAFWLISQKDERVNDRDVQFAKAMIVHHQAAVDMCRDYNRNPLVNNLYLQQMCLDIIVDQQQDIAFMKRAIAAYPGDVSSITITADMVHGMEGMTHGGGHHHGH